MTKVRLSKIALLAIGLMVFVPACGDDGTSPDQNPTGTPTLREIRDVDYVRNKFFFIDHTDAFTGADAATVKVYRGILPQDFVTDPTLTPLDGWAVSDPDGWGFPMHDIVILLNSGQLPTNALEDRFKYLEEGVDYSLIQNDAGAVIGLELTEAIPDAELRSLAVSYISVDGWVVGGTYQQLGVQPSAPGYLPSKLLLEMLRAPDPDPQGMFATTWALEMRHIYDLGSTRINSSTLEINVVDILTARLNPSYPDGSTVPYLQIFGLDQTDMAATGPPDGRIDLSGGRVDVIRGLLYFPVSQAFRPDASSVDAWTNGEFSFTGPYAAQYDASLAIYNEELTPTRADEVHQYMIQVRTVE